MDVCSRVQVIGNAQLACSLPRGGTQAAATRDGSFSCGACGFEKHNPCKGRSAPLQQQPSGWRGAGKLGAPALEARPAVRVGAPTLSFALPASTMTPKVGAVVPLDR